MAGETFELYSRNILDCIKALYGDAEFARYLVFAPERHYMDADKTMRLYHDMHTGKWWWEVQVALWFIISCIKSDVLYLKKVLEEKREGATVVPVILSSDRTRVTLFGNKTAYPVYLTIGNIPKHIRRKPSQRAQVLLAYLPTTKLGHITNQASRRRTLANVFHACMHHVLKPLESAGITGIHMTSGDGKIRRGHPIFAAYVGDYPEQLLVTAIKFGECPKCDIPRDKLGDNDVESELRNLEEVLHAFSKADEHPTDFANACRDAGVKPIYHPFWIDLPYAHVFRSITPDILHQLYQGFIKHMIEWLKSIYSEAEIDARCKRLPPNHNIRLFQNGISGLANVSGAEHNQICRFLLGIIIDLRLPGDLSSARLLRAVRATLDFLYIAQFPIHSSETLHSLNEALRHFHDNKAIFVELGVRENFNIPKLHSFKHYVTSIKLFGTTDNYDTQYTERLHIDLTKDAHRATNMKDEFSQMTIWLERREKILRHERYIQWRLASRLPPGRDFSPGFEYEQYLKMTKHPSAKAVSLDSISEKYHAPFFRDALARYVVQTRNPTLNRAQVEAQSIDIFYNFRTLPVYHKIRYRDKNNVCTLDSVHVRPESRTRRGRLIPGRFDTVLVNDGTGDVTGVKGEFFYSFFPMIFAIFAYLPSRLSCCASARCFHPTGYGCQGAFPR